MKLKVTVNETEYEIDVEVAEDRQVLGPVVVDGAAAPAAAAAPVAASGNAITAPLAGSVARILVAEGDEVTAGQVVVVLEAMKMETEINAPSDGKVSAILVAIGDAVQGGQALVDLG
ncbi:MAG: acetyl-CoA carboxylase biotin carboxyl carrier protein subunit [Arachnia propionica]|nr:MAG: acetyl-CoA carboxylase biotin carboxyl carrier protein subunit [Arachnia propionica]